MTAVEEKGKIQEPAERISILSLQPEKDYLREENYANNKNNNNNNKNHNNHNHNNEKND